MSVSPAQIRKPSDQAVALKRNVKKLAEQKQLVPVRINHRQSYEVQTHIDLALVCQDQWGWPLAIIYLLYACLKRSTASNMSSLQQSPQGHS